MVDEKEITRDLGLREKLDWKFQLNQQFALFRWALSGGDVEGTKRTGSKLKDMLWNHFTPEEKIKFNLQSGLILHM